MDETRSAARVLFVEDEADLRRSYRRHFAPRFTVEFATSGAEALDRCARFQPDVLVLDLRLPDTDGLDVLRQVRKDRPDLPAIITSAYTSMEPVAEVLGVEHVAFLVKPFALQRLEAAILDAIG